MKLDHIETQHPLTYNHQTDNDKTWPNRWSETQHSSKTWIETSNPLTDDPIENSRYIWPMRWNLLTEQKEETPKQETPKQEETPEFEPYQEIETYAEAFEDIIMLDIIKKKKITAMTYLEIGVNDPIISNNTYLFYQHGISGVLVEPLYICYQKIQEVRPRDVLIKGGITHDNKEYAVIKKKGIHGGGSYITEDKFEGTRSCYKVPMHNINKIIETYYQDIPTVLSIDTEGMDYAILKTLEYKIPIICVETVITQKVIKYTTETPDIHQLLTSRKYKLEYKLPNNSIYVSQ